MASYFLCLTSSSGIPLYSKTRNALQQLPFPVIGSLNGVHMFGSTLSVDLLSSVSKHSIIFWKTYNDSLTLILVCDNDGLNEAHSRRLLDYTYNCMVLLYGVDNLVNIKNIERFKKEIKVCNELLDYVLDLLETPSITELTHCVELVTGSECLFLQNYLDTFCEAATSPYGCLVVCGKVAVATKKWWQLSALELVLLSMLTASLHSCASRDIPVFLPVTSPQVPHRLLTFHLLPSVEVCVLCGPSPSLVDLEREVDRFWRSSVDSLKSLKQNNLRVLPPEVELDKNIESVLVINTDAHRCLCSILPNSRDVTHTASQHEEARTKALHVLRSFYKFVCGSLWKPAAMDTNQDAIPSDSTVVNCGSGGGDCESYEQFSHVISDTYRVSNTHKCYALQQGVRQIYVVTNTQVPTYALRSVTNNTLQTILKEKYVLL